MKEHHKKVMGLHTRGRCMKVLGPHMKGRVRSMLELWEIHTRHWVHYILSLVHCILSQAHYIHHLGRGSSHHSNRNLFVYGGLGLAHRGLCPYCDCASYCVFAFDVYAFVLGDGVELSGH